jgi:dolichol-phosphate mannosyltransferase
MNASDIHNVPEINILIPLYNEQDTFPELESRLVKILSKIKFPVTVIMVDDGSTDGTPFMMEDLSLRDSRFNSVFLSRNFGHQLALTAGFSVADASHAVFVIDGDLQDPPELLDEFYGYFKDGYDVVYAIRKNRKESIIRVFSYNLFYRILKKISYVKIPLDSGDFSLISRRVVDRLSEMKEESRFIRGMRTWVGFKQIGVPYDRGERNFGTSKYSFFKLLKLALNGIFNFSEIPIKFITILGFTTILISLTYLIYTLLNLIIFNQVPQGFTGLIVTITLFGGVQLLSIGILGEYILRIFFQVKNRPLFIIKQQIFNGKKVL